MVEGGDRERDLEAGNVWRMTRGRSSATRRRVCGRKGPGGRRQAIVELGCPFCPFRVAASVLALAAVFCASSFPFFSFAGLIAVCQAGQALEFAAGVQQPLQPWSRRPCGDAR